MKNPLLKTANHQKVLKDTLSKKSFQTENLPFVTNRQVHHWKEIGLIDDYRKYASSGFRSTFNFIEALWIRMIIEMRSFRIGNNTIKEVKQYLFESSQQKRDFNETNFAEIIQEVIMYKSMTYIVVFSDGVTKLLKKDALIQSLNEEQITYHFCMRLDILTWELIEILDFNSEINLIIQ